MGNLWSFCKILFHGNVVHRFCSFLVKNGLDDKRENMTYQIAEADKKEKIQCPCCYGLSPHEHRFIVKCGICNKRGWIWKEEKTFLKLQGRL